MKKILCIAILSIIGATTSFSQMSFGFGFTSNAKDSVMVTIVLPLSPAAAADVRVNDLLQSVNGINLRGKSLDAISQIFKQQPDNNNSFIINRNGNITTLKINKGETSSFSFTCLSANCTNGYCEIKTADYYIVKGTCKNGTINGQGQIFYSDGTTLYYKGELQNNLAHGQGTSYLSNGGSYTGQFKNGKINGKGKYTISETEFMEGNWTNGLLNGYGVYVMKNGDKYEGDFIGSKYDGDAVYTYRDGRKYTGKYKDNLKEGKGVFTWPSGTRFEGNWVKDERSGKGLQIHDNGDKYDGEWLNDKRNGKGVYNFKDGRKYDGEWKDNLENGNGVFTFPDGRKFTGVFVNDVARSGTLQYPDGKKITGEFNDLTPVNGKATIYYANGKTETYNGTIATKSMEAPSNISIGKKGEFETDILDIIGYTNEYYMTLRGGLIQTVITNNLLNEYFTCTHKLGIFKEGLIKITTNKQNTTLPDSVEIMYPLSTEKTSGPDGKAIWNYTLGELMSLTKNRIINKSTGILADFAPLYYYEENGVYIKLISVGGNSNIILYIGTAMPKPTTTNAVTASIKQLMGYNYTTVGELKGSPYNKPPDNKNQYFNAKINTGFSAEPYLYFTTTQSLQYGAIQLPYTKKFNDYEDAVQEQLKIVQAAEAALGIHLAFDNNAFIFSYRKEKYQNPVNKNNFLIGLHDEGNNTYSLWLSVVYAK